MKLTKETLREIIKEVIAENETITKYDVKFGNKTIKNIPTEMLEVVKMQEHSHEATEDEEEKDDE
jgi:ribosome recycling factor